MKLKILILLMAALPILMQSCETSEGLKYGTLQKLSHKKLPCNYYVAEFAFEGGRVEGNDQGKAYSNTQEVEVTKAAYDSLQSYIGDKVIYDYDSRGMVMCGSDKLLTSIKRKT